MKLNWLYLQTSAPEGHSGFCLEEGFYVAFERLIEKGILSELVIVMETTRDEVIKVNDKVSILLTTDINIDDKLHEGDIVLCRGGFRSWYPLLNRINDRKIPLLFYRAASNRHFWTFWNIVLEDIDPRIAEGAFVDKDRMYLPIVKPAHPRIFYPDETVTQDYDVCIGASHVHSKKGQIRAVRGLIEAQKQLGIKFKCVMPGRPPKRSILEEIQQVAIDGGLDIDYPGMVDRVTLATIFNRSKMYLHLATCGQNDRGILEAMACGVPSMIGYPKFHPPYMVDNDSLVWLADDADDPTRTGGNIAAMYKTVQSLGKDYRITIRQYYLAKNGMREHLLPQFEKLFKYLKENPVMDRPKLWEYYGARRA